MPRSDARGACRTACQPLPRVDPALLFVDFLDESEASLRPAFDNAALEGLPIAITSFLGLALKRDRRV